MKKFKRGIIGILFAVLMSFVLPYGVRAEGEDIVIDETTFPDENFREQVSENADTNKDGTLDSKEISNVNYFEIQGAKDLTGIEKFTSLQQLSLRKFNYADADLALNSPITDLCIFDSKMNTLNLNGCINLSELELGHVTIKSNLDLKDRSSLTKVLFRSGTLNSLKINNCPKLKSIYAYGNTIKRIDINDCPKLEKLDCSSSHLKNLTIAECPGLSDLNCRYNQIQKLNLNGCPKLKWLNFESNEIKNINLRNLTKLEELNCSSNQLSKLNLQYNTKLERLECSGNKLTTLDVTKQKVLSFLDCSDNSLKVLDLSGNTNLFFLNCSKNKLKALSFSKLYSLNHVECNQNLLTFLDLSWKPDLTYLYCAHNRLTSLYLSGSKSLSFIDCSSNSLKELSVYHCSDYLSTALSSEGTKTKSKTSSGKTILDYKYIEIESGFDECTDENGEPLEIYEEYLRSQLTIDAKTKIINKRTAWKNKGGKKYCYDNAGKLCKGLVKWGQNTYYFNPKTGAMMTGWLSFKGKMRYFKKTGEMAVNEYIKGYYVNKKGFRTAKAKCSWKKTKKGKRYGNASGWYAKGTTLKIDGKTYTFKKNGYVK